MIDRQSQLITPVNLRLIISLTALSAPCLGLAETVLIPPVSQPPAKVNGPADIAGLLEDQQKFWGGLKNAQNEMDKMNAAVEKERARHPKDTTAKYDIYVKDDKFVGVFKQGDDVLTVGGAKVAMSFEAPGTGPSKGELEKEKADKDRQEAAAKAERDKAAADKASADKAAADKLAKEKAESEKQTRESSSERNGKEVQDRIKADRERYQREGGPFRAP